MKENSSALLLLKETYESLKEANSKFADYLKEVNAKNGSDEELDNQALVLAHIRAAVEALTLEYQRKTNKINK